MGAVLVAFFVLIAVTFASWRYSQAEKVGLALVLIAFEVSLFVVAFALMRRKPWARYLGIFYSALLLLAFPVGTLIGGYALLHLVIGWNKPDGDTP